MLKFILLFLVFAGVTGYCLLKRWALNEGIPGKIIKDMKDHREDWFFYNDRYIHKSKKLMFRRESKYMHIVKDNYYNEIPEIIHYSSKEDITLNNTQRNKIEAIFQMQDYIERKNKQKEQEKLIDDLLTPPAPVVNPTQLASKETKRVKNLGII